MIGQTLDRYTIESKLGEGGMGVVYKARDTRLDRLVAIKVLPPDKLADSERKRRFVQEAKAASALNHPNIVTVHDIRSDSGVDFIVMEYASGRTLHEIIPANGLTTAQSLRYGVQIADALARAHEAGIVHRDLKPSNVMVGDDGRVKLLDFGLAKLLEPPAASVDDTRTSPLTEAGVVMGTTAYMSPEQAEGRRVDARSDIFSFGAVLYEMLTGRRPFVGDSQLSVLAKILREEPAPPSSLASSVPQELDRTVLRCLRKDPARRFQTMADLKVALEDLAADSSPSQLPAARIGHPPRVWRWAWLAIMPVVGLAVYFVSTKLQSPDSPPLKAVPLTTVPGGVRSPSFSPDGNHVVFTWTGTSQDNPDLYVQQIGAGTPLRLTTHDGNDYSPVWSPDGRAIVFLRQTRGARHELRLVPPLGGPERMLTDIHPGLFLRAVTLAWCPDSSCVVVTDAAQADGKSPHALFVVSIESGEKKQLTSPERPFLADTDPAVSPDGRWLVFRRDVAPFSGQLRVVQLDAKFKTTGEPRALTPILLTAYAPRWISNSEIIFSGKGSLWRMNVREGRIPERLPFVGENGVMPAVWRPQAGRPGRLAYIRSSADTNVWRIETSTPGGPASSSPQLTIASTRRDMQAQFSPDSHKIVFVSDRSGELEIWVADSSGANPVQLTSLAATPGYPRWSRDGRDVVFHSNAEQHPYGAVFVVPAGGGKARQVTFNASTDVFASFSSDGRWIYFSSSRTETPSVWKVPVSGGEAAQVTDKRAYVALESKDGASVYFVDSRSLQTPGALWRLPLKGGEAERLAEGVMPEFDLVAGGAYYFERLAGETRLRYFDFTKRQSTLVAEKLGRVVSGPGASSDGRIILFARVDSLQEDLMLVENFR